MTGQLLDCFHRHSVTAVLVAYSGGLDSHVLLHAAVHGIRDEGKKSLNIRAIHINHNLQPESATWVEHCRRVCQQLAVELEIVTLQLAIPPGSSTEAVARAARYQAFHEHLQPGEVLLTAHHQDDQAETLLLNLLRGSGPEGLAAMPESRSFAASVLLRPLLGLNRAQLQAYAQQQQLQWLDDPSNASLQFDRNYLRHAVMPRLTARWPTASRLLARSAQWQGETTELMRDLLADKLQQVRGEHEDTLSVSALLACSVPLQKALLRQWLRECGFTVPSAKKLQHILTDVLAAKADAQPCVSWRDCEVRRYRGEVYALTPLSAHDAQQVWTWLSPYEPLLLDSINVVLDKQVLGDWWLPKLEQSAQILQVRFRQGGEKLQRGRQHISLKQWLQDKGIPPWQRERLPLIYAGEQLVVIPGLFVLGVDN